MPFSIVNKGEGWLWCSLLDGNELTIPVSRRGRERRQGDARNRRAEYGRPRGLTCLVARKVSPE
jgi:hypothetical protein